jgi:hypothetical protein
MRQDEVAHRSPEFDNQLLSFQKLGDDWDGLGAKALPMSLIASAVELAQTVQHDDFRLPCQVVPGPDGEIILDWQGRGTYWEAEICQPDTAEWMLVLPDGRRASR